jgi:hypothetical protein
VTPRPRSLHHRPVLRRAVVIGVALTIAVSGTALAQVGSSLDTFGGMFGVGDSFGIVSPDTAGAMVASDLTLGQLDLGSGALHGGDVANPASVDAAVVADLSEQGLLQVDLTQVAEQARRQAEAARRAEEAKRREGGVGLERAPDPGTPARHELKSFSTCGHPQNATKVARIEVVDLFETMCRAAEGDGVPLFVNSGFRDPAHQLRLYRDAVAKYGSEAAARRWVAWSDGQTCSSRHCSGTAVDVSMSQSAKAHGWMHSRVGCANRGAVRITSDPCASGEQVIKRVQLYGFVLPMDHEPWHIEQALMTGATGEVEGSCNPPRSYSNPQIIAAVWRCRLTAAGLPKDVVERSVAEALVVAKCESGWNANAVVFGGRYLNTPHPTTGLRYSAAGLFQFIRSSANSWVPGGYANVKDPVANSDAAARYWLSGYRSGGRQAAWRPWACAAVNDGFAKRSVLPGFPGGPSALPSYAWQY